MFNEFIRDKLDNILHFFLSTFKVVFLSFLLSFILLIVLSIIITSQTGDWSLGVSFEEWWSSMASIPQINGKFSAIDFKTCWSCNLMAKSFDLMSMLGLKLYIYISDIAWTLITMGFGVWILIFMYDNLIKKQSDNFENLFKEITTKIVVIGIIGAGLFFSTDKNKNEQYLTKIVNSIVEVTAVPVLKMGIGVSSQILQTNICDKFNYPETEVDGIITHGLKKDMLCLMNTVNAVYLSAMTAGANMINMSWNGFLANPVSNAKQVPDIFAGMALEIIFFLMFITIPIMLIDIVFTLGILVCFLPLMIGGYAYKQTSGFSKLGISSIWGMCFYIIMYSIFLGILYSSFVYIADMYYPAPLDNFTYLFPDFIYNDMVDSQTSKIMLSEGFKNCYDNSKNISQIQTCLARIGIDFEIPSIEKSGGAFLPMFTFGLLSLMIMGNVKKYAGLISGYTFEVGKHIQSFLHTTFDIVKNKVSRTASGFIEKKNYNSLKEEIEKDKKNLKDKIN